MILQSLKDYYDRLATDPDSTIPPVGFERKEIPFLIVIKPDGGFVKLEDTREQVKSGLAGKTFLVPRSIKRSGVKSYETTFLLWDHIGYVLQYPESDEKVIKQHATWLKKLDSLPDSVKNDESIAAVLKFYTSGGVSKVKSDSNWDDCSSIKNCNVTFRLAGDSTPVTGSKAVQEFIASELADDESDESVTSRCLITGEVGLISRTHGRTPINKDTKSLVSFQKNSGYDSYGKEQGYNAPVCKSAEFAYTTALNHLLRKNSPQKMIIGDATTVFWAEKPNELETSIVDIFGDPPKDDPDRGVNAVRSLYKAVETGAISKDEGNAHFYVLGLSPNAARIAVRFWIVDTIEGMGSKIVQHFKDLEIVHGRKTAYLHPLWKLLASTAVQGKVENIPPNLAGNIVRAILSGLPYPQTLLQAALRRLQAESIFSSERASLIKAFINRKTRYSNSQIEEELKVSLDDSNTNIGYRLGRLFAILEKIQSEANPGIKATIRDRFYSSASGTPISVFSTLMRLKIHHLAKMENSGRRIYFEKLISEVMSPINDFPPHLPLPDQGRFAIGYYHQMNDLYTKKEK